MKKIATLLLILVLASCNTETINYAIISGTIQDTDAKKITLYSDYDMNDKQEIQLQEDGSFLDTIYLEGNSFYSLIEKRNRTMLFLEKGGKIAVNYTSSDYKSTISIEGDGKQVSSYLSDKMTESNELRRGTRKIYTLEEAQFIDTLDVLKNSMLEVLQNAEGLSADFISMETNNIDYEFLGMMNRYEVYHGYYGKKSGFKASEDFKNNLDTRMTKVVMNNEDEFMFSSNYRSLVESYYQDQAIEMTKKDSIGSDVAILKILADVETETIKNKLLFDNAVFGITWTDNLEEFYSAFTKGQTNEKYKKIITEKYNDLKSLAKGQDSPKFYDYENNAGGTTSLDDLKGKYLYIDVWATWCGPCIAEIPSLKKIEKEFHDKNINFVSISIDVEDDHDKWKKMIVDRALGGTQLMADNDWNSKFIKDYLISGIPRFIIIDPEGKIVDYNAPRPSNKELKKVLKEDLNL